jgi:hypothetical protein
MLVLVVTVLIALLVAAIFLVSNIASAKHSLPVTAEWIDDLSVARYRPMLRLLDSREIKFLASQPGYTSSMERQFRTRRCQLFRGYLDCLQGDFGRVVTALKILVAQSQQDRPDLAAVLVRHQILFVSGVLAIQIRLMLYRLGICGVDLASVAQTAGLVHTFDAMRMELRHMVPTSVTAFA